ncbi:putative bifunctional diguanylate cyclase/phosphodiesterase [Devosia sediminis]|uniref:EAL domain-containing protein n=1 Tax=Devosia sediminis TaxID=2798801 RepID=A0A934J0G9_9HYPH|nr:EAL domain-containing protein [Devosia sediminis]MBJ3786520.1 EAL domain-containing protein [Devosia sediminis]
MLLTPSARKTMPALDYVSVIRSVYGDRGAMLAGSLASAFAAGLTAWKVQSIPLYVVAGLFLLLGLIRDANMRAFWKAAISADDVDGAEYWENRAVIWGGALALIYGMWCLVAMLIVRDPYAELVSASLTIAVMVGICARNFGLDRLVTIQMLMVILPLSLGLLLRGDFFHPVLAILLIIMLSSFRKLAADIRAILLSAVHGRVEASRLAAELDMAITTLDHGLCLLDDKGTVSVANEQALKFFSLVGAPNLLRSPLPVLLRQQRDNGRLPHAAVDRLLDLIERHTSGKVLLCLPEGGYYEVTVSSGRDRCVLLFEDISERVAAQERINFMARHDTLTGLPNRAYFGELVADDLAARRHQTPPATHSLMIIDIDDFKHVNDTFGHIVGDQLLVDVAQRLRNVLTEDAVLARLGGDEFVIYGGATGDQASERSQRVMQAFARPFNLDSVTLNVNASLGLVTSALAEDSLDDLMTKADLALYSAKAEGKATSQIFHAQMDVDYHYRQRLKGDLRQAIATGGLSLAFQPLLDISTRKVVSCEALARWDHPELGPVPPSTFIPLAEEIGVISDITEWVIAQAALQCSQWPGQVGVAVNVSARDFRAIDLQAVVETALARTGLGAERLEIEVTETAVIEERDIAINVLSGLAARGVGIALDDFGTGYSSLSYLSALPFSKLKIDRSFVADIAEKPRALRLLTNVARLGRDLDLVVVAEGVETEAQLNAMVDNTTIQQVQGYLFSRPLPQRDIAELISRLNAGALAQTKRRIG